MKTLFSNGGPLFNNDGLLFMGILSLVLIILLGWAIYQSLPVFKNQSSKYNSLKRKIKHLKSIGLFALILGILHQLINLYSIMTAIEEAGDINANIVLSALKTSMIPMLYGIFIYLLSIILWVIFDLFIKSKMENQT